MVVLNDDTLVEPLLAALKENNINGGTLIDSQGMNSLLNDIHPEQVPLFASFRIWASNLHPQNKTFFSVIEDEKEQLVISLVSRVFDYFQTPGKGIAFTISLDSVVGFKNYDLER
jgi:hypothetical protein